MLVLADQCLDPVSIVALNVGSLLAEVSKLVQERDAVDEVLVDDGYLVLQRYKRYGRYGPWLDCERLVRRGVHSDNMLLRATVSPARLFSAAS